MRFMKKKRARVRGGGGAGVEKSKLEITRAVSTLYNSLYRV